MKPRTKISFFAFPFGDYEGVRQYLNHQAASGWAFVGRYGLLTAKFQETKRQELCYDVLPADPRRSLQQLQQEVTHRESAGWKPIATLWGMDIYQSLPCQGPAVERTPEDYRRLRALFSGWLLWSLAFLGVTLAILAVLAHLFSLTWQDLSKQWYLSDSRTVLSLALPLGALLALDWLGWLCHCIRTRCKPHKPCSTAALRLRGAIQALALVLLGVTLAVLWLDQVPRLWMRLGLALLLLLSILLAPICAGGNQRRQTLIWGSGVFACLLLAMVLGWTVAPLEYDTFSNGTAWRQSDQLPLLRAEDLDFTIDAEEVNAYYSASASLLVSQQSYHERWSESGLTLEVTVYTCRLPGLAGLVWDDLLPASAQEQDSNTATLSSDSWYQLWYRQGNRIYAISGTADWSVDDLGARAIAILTQ